MLDLFPPMRLLRVGLAASLLAACAAGPDYTRPPMQAPAAFKEAPQGWKVAEPQDTGSRDKWWEVFGDSELNVLVERVPQANATLRAALANYTRAQALLRQSRAGLFPTVTGNVGTSRGNSSGTGRGPSTVDTVSLGAAWEPDLWGRVRRDVESQNATVVATLADLESTRLSLQAQLVQNYVQLRLAEAQRAVLDETVQGYTRALELTRNRYTQGVVTRADVAQAQAQLATAQAQYTDADITRAQLEHAIATLVGVTPAELTIAVDPQRARAMPVPDVPGLVPSQLLERRPDIAGAERRVAAANAQIGVAQAAWFPVLDLSGSVGYRNTSWANLLSTPNRIWSLGATLAETIFDGGRRDATIDVAKASYDASVANYREAVLAAFQEVEDNLATLRVLADEARYQQESVRAARESLELTTNQYKAGTVSFLNVLTAQNTLLNSQLSELNLRGRQLLASAGLIKALGGGWTVSRLERAQ